MFQAGDVGGRVRTLTRMHGLTIFIFSNLSIGVAAGLNFFLADDRFITAETLANTGFLISILSISVAAGLNFFVLHIRLEPSADTSARRPASKRGEDRTAGRAIGYIITTSTFVPRPLPFISSDAFRLFAHSRAKTTRGRVPRGFLPSRRFCWAQVQTGGAITAEPDACRPIIKIIESQENRLPSDNLYSDYRKSG